VASYLGVKERSNRKLAVKEIAANEVEVNMHVDTSRSVVIPEAISIKVV